jgi:hypothetical protein
MTKKRANGTSTSRSSRSERSADTPENPRASPKSPKPPHIPPLSPKLHPTLDAAPTPRVEPQFFAGLPFYDSLSNVTIAKPETWNSQSIELVPWLDPSLHIFPSPTFQRLPSFPDPGVEDLGDLESE